jgi:photosystem II stability/assembly factor-like uncharacterized protein
MSEPVVRRTNAGQPADAFRVSAFNFQSPLARALSLCGVISALALLATPAMAQGDDLQYALESPKAVSSLALDIVHAGSRLVTVGERGHILFSDDNGVNWVQARVPTRQLLTAATFVDDQYGWVVGHDAQILATRDGGATWQKQFEDLEREAPLLDVWFENRQHGLAVGAYGALLETHDGGQTWEDVSDRLDNDDAQHLNAIAPVKNAGLVIVGEMGALFRSADWGETWERLESPYDGSLFGALGTQQANTVVIYGLRGHIYRSTDFGANWKSVQVNVPGNGSLEFGLSGGSLLKDGSLVIVGHGGSVLASQNDGRSFSVFNRPDRQSLSAVSADQDGRLLLVGQGGIHRSDSTAAQLAEQQ